MTSSPLEFVSESITPDPGTFDVRSLAIGDPGLPTGFTWRKQHYSIVELIESWRESEAENHTSGEKYYRKRFFKVLVDTEETMTLYCVRHVKAGQSAKKRWWLYTIGG